MQDNPPEPTSDCWNSRQSGIFAADKVRTLSRHEAHSLNMLCEVGAEFLTSKEVLQQLIAVDEEIEILKKALCPFVRGVPVTPDVDDATIEKMIVIKCNLEEQRRKVASLQVTASLS